MKNILNSIFILGLLAFSNVAHSQDNDSAGLAERLSIAKEYSKAVPVGEEVAASIEQLILQVPVKDRPVLKSILQRTIKVDQLQSVSEMSLAELFTTEELKALVAFYQTPEGKAIKSKMPQYQEKIQPVLEQMIRDAVELYQKQAN